ncbi:MAG TPA: PucR family transcriptional regulator ligand-binding domain-containing protein [Pseudonocardia sp.]|jgi:DNA-binding PucR family transcriptional regulator|nr:PucR family transcriptional regulator ligand-binding domain-containing protein [Pseudonocardia sp.]
MLVRELLDVPELRLRLLAGQGGALERPVRWVYSTDLGSPGRYLSGGELVISGLVWRHEAADSERFVAEIAAAGAAALAAGEAFFHGIPDDVVQACERHKVVLLAVPEDVSFTAVTEHVIRSVTAARGDRLAARLGRQRQLLTAVAGGMSLDELSTQVSDATGLVCRVLTPTGRAIVPGPAPLGGAAVDRIVRAFLTADRLPAIVPGRPAYSVFPVGPALEQRLTYWFAVVEGAWPEWEPDVADAVGELVAIAALDRARRTEGWRVARDIADDAVGLIAAGSGGRPETVARLRQAGLDPDRPVAVAVAGFVDRPDLTEVARSVLDDAAAHLGPPVVGTTPDGLAVALLPMHAAGPSGGVTAGPGGVAAGAGEEPLAALRTALGRLEPGLGPARLTVGLSRPSGADALSGALREARHARELAKPRPGALAVVADAEVTSHVALLAAVPDDVRHAFAARVLDPILEYDARNDAGLYRTLEAFLSCSGSWSKAAALLHLHINTVRYRIGRVEELTGRDLSRFEDRVDIFLALRSR